MKYLSRQCLVFLFGALVLALQVQAQEFRVVFNYGDANLPSVRLQAKSVGNTQVQETITVNVVKATLQALQDLESESLVVRRRNRSKATLRKPFAPERLVEILDEIRVA